MQLTIRQPDDWHLHLRDGDFLATTVLDTAKTFARAIVMPNLKPPIETVESAAAYRHRILAEVPSHLGFEPLMTLYLTPKVLPKTIAELANTNFIKAVKLYPKGATTNSDAGIVNLDGVMATLEAMSEYKVPLLVHGEVTDPSVDIFDREAVFLEQILHPLMKRVPELKIVLEHITTKESVDFVREHSGMGATITAHHLIYDRNDMLSGGIRPHLYCLPILKRRLHQEALLQAATSGSSQFFLGTDSAPHTIDDKESACGCAGCYSAPYALPLYAEVFEAADALHRLEGFASEFGPIFYRLPLNSGTITLIKEESNIPDLLPFGNTELRPIRGGEEIMWRLQ